MQIHFDWTVTPTTIVSALWFLIVLPGYHFLRKLNNTVDQVLNWLKEYRPHAHTEHGENSSLTVGGIVYPRSMNGKD